MFDDITVNARIKERHPELQEDDVKSAWNNAVKYAERTTGSIPGPLLVAIGTDSKGRLLEMVGVATSDAIHIFRAMTPPSKKTIEELGMK